MKSVKHKKDPSSATGLLAQIGLFQKLNAAQLDRIGEHLQSRDFLAGTVFLHKDQSAGGLYFLCEGSVKVFLPAAEQMVGHSKEVVIAICGAGEALGEIDLADGAGHTASVATLEVCRVWWMDGADFRRCHDFISQLERNLSRLLARRIRWCTTAQDASSSLNLQGKAATCLLLLMRDQDVIESNGG